MKSVQHYALVAAALLGLLALTVGVAYLRLGAWNTPVALLVAGVKATLIVIFFMQVRREGAVTRLYAVAGFFWLALLFLLTLSDVLTRG